MKKIKSFELNFITDAIAFALFVFLISTGFLIYFVLPPGSGQACVWGLTRHEWGSIHFVLAIILLIVMFFHLLLHWHWIMQIIKGRRRERMNSRLGLAITILIALILAALILFLGPKEGRRHFDKDHMHKSGNSVYFQMVIGSDRQSNPLF